jgi:hypothetical protein
MSALAAHTERASRRVAKRRVAERSRRADDGTVTELARALLRDARHAQAVERTWPQSAMPVTALRTAPEAEPPAQAA